MQPQFTVTSLLFHPYPLAGVRLTKAMTGMVLSILIVTETELDRPALFVAEQVSTVPVVSEVKMVEVQPMEVRMPDCGSETVQVTVTLLLYQPFVPNMPEILGLMTGGVLSKIVGTL